MFEYINVKKKKNSVEKSSLDSVTNPNKLESTLKGKINYTGEQPNI